MTTAATKRLPLLAAALTLGLLSAPLPAHAGGSLPDKDGTVRYLQTNIAQASDFNYTMGVASSGELSYFSCTSSAAAVLAQNDGCSITLQTSISCSGTWYGSNAPYQHTSTQTVTLPMKALSAGCDVEPMLDASAGKAMTLSTVDGSPSLTVNGSAASHAMIALVDFDSADRICRALAHLGDLCGSPGEPNPSPIDPFAAGDRLTTVLSEALATATPRPPARAAGSVDPDSAASKAASSPTDGWTAAPASAARLAK